MWANTLERLIDHTNIQESTDTLPTALLRSESRRPETRKDDLLPEARKCVTCLDLEDYDRAKAMSAGAAE